MPRTYDTHRDTQEAFWAGVGLVITSLVSVFVFKQTLDLPAIIGIAFIVMGVVIMNVFSRSTAH